MRERIIRKNNNDLHIYYRPSERRVRVSVIEENIKTDKVVHKYEPSKLKKHQELGVRKFSKKKRKKK